MLSASNDMGMCEGVERSAVLNQEQAFNRCIPHESDGHCASERTVRKTMLC